jgi:hypothetical protein
MPHVNQANGTDKRVFLSKTVPAAAKNRIKSAFKQINPP